MTIEFLFDIDDLAEISGTGETGIISAALVDDAGQKTYYVKTANGGNYWPERLLIKRSASPKEIQA